MTPEGNMLALPAAADLRATPGGEHNMVGLQDYQFHTLWDFIGINMSAASSATGQLLDQGCCMWANYQASLRQCG